MARTSNKSFEEIATAEASAESFVTPAAILARERGEKTYVVNIAKRYYASMGRDIDIIKLNGSIELAPILGLSDVIVDIVETGTTLRENGLQVVTEFMPISARFIANKASYQFKHRQMDTMLEKLRDTLHKQEEEK